MEGRQINDDHRASPPVPRGVKGIDIRASAGRFDEKTI